MQLDVIIAFRGEDVKESIGNRIDVLSSSLETSFGSIKEKLNIDPSAYVEGIRDEVAELYIKYRVIMSKLAPAPVKSFFEWYRNRTLAGNPTMKSVFSSSLDELKERVLNRRND